MKNLYLLLILLLCIFSVNLYSQPAYEFPLFASGLSTPVGIAHAGDERLFVVQQGGTIVILDLEGNRLGEPFLDIRDRVLSGGERGLLGLAFHPGYSSNGYFFVHYTRSSDGVSVISRFSVSTEDPDKAIPGSERILMTINQPYSNHNGGSINFGNDGYLYIGMGDGGSGGDPDNYSQNRLSHLGKMLRIDVDNGDPYAIPEDNPFVHDDATLSEIYALGLRNPWRFSFDPLNGDLWIADVGQNRWEEVNHQIGGTPGGQNYGWRCYEGFEPYNTNGCGDISEYVMPVAVYGRAGDGGCSISGGEVYRGTKMTSLYGMYLYADYCSDNIWAISRDEEGNYEDFILTRSGQVFGTVGLFSDVNKDIYLVHLGGRIHKMVSDECNNSGPLIFEDLETEMCSGDTIVIKPVRISDDPHIYTLYKGDELLYSVTDTFLYIFEPGSYMLVEEVGVCMRTSTIIISLKGDSNAQFDGLPDVVDIDDDIIVLVSEVAGGEFSGSGVVGNTFNPQLAGLGQHLIRYTITEPGLCEAYTERAVEVGTTSVRQRIKDIILKVNPNPVTGDILYIEFLSSDTYDFEADILDLNGRSVYKQLLRNTGVGMTSYKLDISGVPAGFFLLRLSNEEGQVLEKLIRK